MTMIIILFLLIPLSGCTSGGNDSSSQDFNNLDDNLLNVNQNKLSADKVDIWWDQSSGIPASSFADVHLEKQFKDTHFKFTEFHTPFIFASPSKNDLFTKLNSEVSPDLIVFNSRFLPLLIEIGYLDPIINNRADDLNIQESALEQINSAAPDHQLYALPFGQNVVGLFYNKAIFNEMNVPYPTDGMTWEDVIALAQRVSNPEKWSALDAADFDLVASQLSIRLYNPATQQVDLESDEWARMEQFAKRLNGLQSKGKSAATSTDSSMYAFSNGRIAMVAGSLYDDTQLMQGFYDQESNIISNGVEWDVVSYPVFNDDKLLAPAAQSLYIGVPRAGKNKEDAFKIMKHLLSKEVQVDNMRNGLASLLDDSASYADEFGQSSSLLSGKSTASFFKRMQEGSFDPSLDDYFIMGHWIKSVVNSETFLADQTLERAKGHLRSDISDYIVKRSKFIDQIKTKTNEQHEME
ncbi:extracellular solute-binding protein [Paenibacillus sp. PR3]|uniref:Extracellular solute-binding protein n=1 Tax=Paenibacillus terricola TaxID=2763503 RepID=A0ABR8N6H6_9BACL|nr:extracellular solute-binding protein [Paenibacillus terricola]MBD3922800.1 extracellular solute-binding protein [Paenibacillus terricola]